MTPLTRKAFIPFQPRFYDALKAGVKTMTSRTRKYGEPGDILQCPVGPIKLVDVRHIPLYAIKTKYWYQEGCKSPDEFVTVWKRLHPRKRYNEEDCVYLHEFELVK